MMVICVDDHPVLLRGLIRNVRSVAPQAEIHGFTAAEEALTFSLTHGCDVLFCEIELYQRSGIWLAEQIRQRFPTANIIFVTVCSEKEHARDVLRLRSSGYLTKPATKGQIAEELQNLRYAVGNGEASPSISLVQAQGTAMKNG